MDYKERQVMLHNRDTYAQGKLAGENWRPDDPTPSSPFPPTSQESVEFYAGLLDVMFPILQPVLCHQYFSLLNEGVSMQPTQNVVRVGTGVMVIRDRKVLLGKRKGSHAAGLYSFPGGHLDFGETWSECVVRELEEECGKQMKVKIRLYAALQPAFFITNDIMPQYGKHYITIFMVADWIEGEPINMEPDKCDGWEWMTFEELAQKADNQECANWIPMKQIIFHRNQVGI